VLFYCVTHVINTKNNEQILLTIEYGTIYNINNIKQKLTHNVTEKEWHVDNM